MQTKEAIDIRERLWGRVLDTTMQIEVVTDGFTGFWPATDSTGC